MYSIKFYADLRHHHETAPCKQHSFSYETFNEADEIARRLLLGVRLEHGNSVGYSITDEQTSRVCHIGPGKSEWDDYSPKNH